MIVTIALDFLAIWAFCLIMVDRIFRVGVGAERGYKRVRLRLLAGTDEDNSQSTDLSRNPMNWL
jgi:hypothetical protein